LEIECGKLTPGFWIQFHCLVQLDRDLVAKFFLSVGDDFSQYSIDKSIW
jgi:hypothetical protein